MDDTSTRIRRITEDLKAIQVELHKITFFDATPEQMAIVDDLLGAGLLADLKDAVDQIRQYLWAYVEASANSGRDLTTAIQGLRLQRVTEMLRVLREDMNDPSLIAVPGSRSFFEEISAIADKTVEVAMNLDPTDQPKTKAAGKK